MLPVVRPVTNSIMLGSEDFEVPSPSHEELKQTYEQLKSFSKGSNAKLIMVDIVFQKRLTKFEVKMTSVLDHVKSLKIDEEQLESVFVMVMQSACDYLYHTDPVKLALKDELIVKLLKPFTKNDSIMCKQLMKFVQCKVKPSTLWRRNKAFAKKCAFFLWTNYSNLFRQYYLHSLDKISRRINSRHLAKITNYHAFCYFYICI